MDFDETKKEQLLAEMAPAMQQEGTTDDESSGVTGAIDKELLEKPYFPETAEAPKKRWNIPSVLRNAARVAAALAIVGVSAYFFLPSFFTSRLSAGTEGKDNSAVAEDTTADSALSEVPTTTTAVATSETAASTVIKTTSETTKAPTTATTTFNDRVTYVSGGRTSGPNGGVSTGGSATTGISPNGFIAMSMDQIKSKINNPILYRYDAAPSETYDYPRYNMSLGSFIDVVERIKRYEWTDHKEYVSPVDFRACQIIVMGNNTYYTYLTFARDLENRCFVWSEYDKKIAYLSESDFGYIKNILLQASV